MSKQDLKNIFWKLAKNSHHKQEIKSSPNVRIACVASIIRWKPHVDPTQYNETSLESPFQLLDQPWVNDCHGQAEMFFIKRADRQGDNWSGHVAFPGGKNEKQDKTNLDTVIRECKEEIGIDLGNPNQFLLLGTLKHVQFHITNSRSNKMMILIPFVFLQVTPNTPRITIQTKEVASTHWVPIKYLLKNPVVPYFPLKDLTDDIKSPWPADVRVSAIPLTLDHSTPYLWGMTLRMTQEILGTPPSRTFMEEGAKSSL